MTQIKSDELALGIQVEPKYRNDTEKEWIEEGFKELERVLGSKIMFTMYEGCTFNLGKNKYTPDFMHFLDNRLIVFVEVKASIFANGYATTKLKLKASATMYNMFMFFEALKVKGGWKITKI